MFRTAIERKLVPESVGGFAVVGNMISSGKVIFTVHSCATGKFVLIVNSYW